MLRRAAAVGLLSLFLSPVRLHADPAGIVTSTVPPPGAAEAQARLKVAPGLQVELWAAEPLVQDVTSLAFDEQGRAYVVESGRRRTSVFDVRNLQPWLEDDYALRSVEDRDAFLSRMLSPGEAGHDAFLKALTKSKFGDFNRDGVVDARDLEVEEERIRLVWDSDGDGRADSARTYAGGFKGRTSGVAAGVLVHGSNVWFTCIPDLWKLPAAGPAPGSSDRLGNAAGAANGILSPADPAVERLLSGFGVHIAFGGHDLHGLQRGPDGRLYFSVADRGTSVMTREGTRISEPDSGAIFRCELDGSRMEVVATGLRNPQELAFDDLGNLWTGDNNGDGGDKARWTLVIEGANYGWTIGWQWLPKMGAWNSERLWHTRASNSAASLMPPVAHIGHGPAGIAHYPGTGLGARYRDHFFYADFPGGIRTFRVEPDGAFFRVVNAGAWMEDNAATEFTGKLLWNLAPVDVAFPPGGGAIVADAFPSWEKTGSARLWRVFDPNLQNDAEIAEVATLLREGMEGRDSRALVILLSHGDQRVRLEAQWELARRGTQSLPLLEEAALQSKHRLARLHALWAIGQLAREKSMVNAGPGPGSLATLLADPDPVIQEAAILVLGESRAAAFAGEILALAESPHPRVTAASLRVAGRLRRLAGGMASVPHSGREWNAETLQRVLIEQHPDDPVVREAKVAALSAVTGSDAAVLETLESSSDPRAQLLAVLAKRRSAALPDLDRALRSSHPQVVLEAARALHDRPTGEAWTSLVGRLADPGFLSRPTESEWPSGLTFTHAEWRAWVYRRVVNATFLLGSKANETHARALAGFAVRSDVPESVRIEALDALADWGQPTRRDRVLGVHRPRTAGDPAHARTALAAVWPDLIARTTVWTGTNAPGLLAALRAGDRLRPEGFGATLESLKGHAVASVREEVARIAALDQPMSTAQWIARLDSGALPEKREAFLHLAESKDPIAAERIAIWMEKLNAGQVAAELQVDVLDAAARAGGERLTRLLDAWTLALPKDDPLARHRPALRGGDAGNGRRMFAERADWGCQRCHKLAGVGGDVGPDLTGIGKTRGLEYVLESILMPNKTIAPGYENVLITRKSGGTVAGMVKSETATELVLDAGEDGRMTIPKADIATRQRGLSSMVEGFGDVIALRELRDLLAALAE